MSPLIIDLAYIMVIAGAVTIIFKRLKQPLVLGYIVAGFLAGPHMPYFPSVREMGGIEDWSQIGVVFLMFTLGLEFSFKKLFKMGVRPIFAALMVMMCMIGVGSSVGWLFDWSNMDRIFLGGMLAMSSTTIIYKAFDDMGLRHKEFAGKVLSVLILEDILGILLMVVLTALAVSRRLEGDELLRSLMQLGFFLILWFIVGIFVVPMMLKRFNKYINKETLLIVSVGLCFLLVVIADKVGYSPAFGAFMMGSILSETVEAERIESSVSSLKDLFGAVFFVSVGMLVDPAVLVQYWLPILVITLAVIGGQMIFGSVSFLVAGTNLREAMQCGFSLAQIGEFAFIIAALGQSLKVTSGFLYPVVVAVSIITTFFTPYVIRLSTPIYKRIEKTLPQRVTGRLNERGNRRKGKRLPVMNLSLAWKEFMGEIVLHTVSYLTLCVAFIMFSFGTILPLFRHLLTHWPGNIACGLLTFLLISPCIRPIVMRKNKSKQAVFIRQYNTVQNSLYWVVVLSKLAIGCAIVYYILNFLSPFWWVWHIFASFGLVLFIISNRFIKLMSIRLERIFKQNLGRRERLNTINYGRRLKGKDLQISRVHLPQNTKWGGRSLSQLHFGKTDHIHIVAIIRGNMRINIPGGNSRIYPGDTLEIVSNQRSKEILQQRLETELWQPDERKGVQDRLSLISQRIEATSSLCGKTLVEADFRSKYHCMVVGIEDGDGNLQVTQAQRQFQEGDIIWIVGEEADLSLMKMAF